MTTAQQVEERLAAVLGAWAAASVVGGGLLALRPGTRGFGRQTAGWGAVDALIAGGGTWLRARRGPTPPDRLRTVLRLNLGLDVGYVVGGLLVARSARARERGWHQDGAAAVVQGLFLLALDGWAERALRPGASAGG